jgi:hypothetical protein
MFAPEPKPPTPSDYAVIAVASSGILIVLGVVAVVMAFRAPPEKHDYAVALEYLGFCSLGIGALIAFIFWLFRRLTD